MIAHTASSSISAHGIHVQESGYDVICLVGNFGQSIGLSHDQFLLPAAFLQCTYDKLQVALDCPGKWEEVDVARFDFMEMTT